MAGLDDELELELDDELLVRRDAIADSETANMNEVEEAVDELRDLVH